MIWPVRSSSAAATVAERDGLDLEVDPASVHLERPARREHGDWSTNIALVAAKQAGAKPRDLAAALVEVLDADPPAHVTSIEIAGPGFVNFRLDDGWLHDALAEVLDQGEDGYARPDVGTANGSRSSSSRPIPTGPIHVGNGWWGSYGDALARVLARAGYRVSREYYVNDTGGQIRTLGESLLARRRGEEVPEGGYQGDYVTELAATYDRSRRRDRRRPVGGRPDPRTHQGHPGLGGDRLRRVVQPGLDRGERRRRRDHRPAGRARAWSSKRTAPPGSGPPSSGTTATGCCASRTATPPTWPATSPTTATSSWCAASTG